jgi:hypothetical protein
MEFNLDRAIEVLEVTPKTLSSLLSGLAEPWLVSNEGPDTFSPRDVLGHLIHGEEDDWIPRTKIILEQGESRAFTPFDRFAFREKYKDKPFPELLQMFEKFRRQNLAFLKNLNLQPNQYELRGTHPEFGPVTLGQLIATWAVHDLGHISQIVRVMAKQYKDAVGPWRKYISLLGCP